MRLTRNPPSPNYTHKLGSGSFASVWQVPQTDHAEIIVRGFTGVNKEVYGEATDAGKEILIKAKMIAMPTVAKFFPTISRKRVDFVQPIEYIYDTVVYRIGTSYYPKNPEPTENCYFFVRIYSLLADIAISNYLLSSDFTGLNYYLNQNISQDKFNKLKIRNFIKALKVIQAVVNSYKSLDIITEYHFDLRQGNIASDNEGNLILLDPIWAPATYAQMTRLWREAGMIPAHKLIRNPKPSIPITNEWIELVRKKFNSIIVRRNKIVDNEEWLKMALELEKFLNDLYYHLMIGKRLIGTPEDNTDVYKYSLDRSDTRNLAFPSRKININSSLVFAIEQAEEIVGSAGNRIKHEIDVREYHYSRHLDWDLIRIDKIIKSFREVINQLKKLPGTTEENLPPYETKFSIENLSFELTFRPTYAPEVYLIDPGWMSTVKSEAYSAYRKMKALNFDFLWYGNFDVCNAAHRGAQAAYNIKKDYLLLHKTPKLSIQHIIIHELAHRYYHRFMDRNRQAQFDRFFRIVPATSYYGSTNPAEDFAEAFAHLVLDQKISREQAERIKAVLDPNYHRTTEPIETRFVVRNGKNDKKSYQKVYKNRSS